MNKKKPKKTFIDHMLTVILILAIGVFCYAGYQLVNIYQEYKEGTDEYQELTQLAVSFVETEKAEDVSSEMISNEAEAEDAENDEGEKESFLRKLLFHVQQLEENMESNKEADAEEKKEENKEENKEPNKEINTADSLEAKEERMERTQQTNAVIKEKVSLTQLAEAILMELPSFSCSSVKVPIEVDFEPLQEMNEDIIGWIYVEGLEEINYPIVQGEDNEVYLHRTYEGNYNFAGTLFIDYKNSSDFKDCNTIIYGHNMKNGSMFGKLKKFVSDPEVYEKSRYFWILTPEANYRYEIISAYTTGVNSDTYTLFYKRDASFMEYLEYIRDCSELETNVRKPAIWDKVVTLSTCTGNDTTRFVVQGIRTGIIPVSVG